MLAWLTVTLTEERRKKKERKKEERKKEGRKKEESQKIDDLPVLATRRSGTSAMLSSKVNDPAFLMEALGNA